MRYQNRLLFATISLALACQAAIAANPYLNCSSTKAHTVLVRGKQWGDGRGGVDTGSAEVACTAKMISVCVAKTSWGGIYKISLTGFAPDARSVKPDYYVVTDGNIALLNESDMNKAVKTIAEAKSPPKFNKEDLRAINSGTLKFVDSPWTTTIQVKGDRCTYLCSHESGHSQTLVWQKGHGLISCGSNYGAMADGYSVSVNTKK